jgi:hypothetical protein
MVSVSEDGRYPGLRKGGVHVGAAPSGYDGLAGCSCSRSLWRYGGRAEAQGDELVCERPRWLVCMGCGARSLMRCRRASRARCGPCSETYRRQVRQVALRGMMAHGRDVFVLTLTAPGDRAHRLPSGKLCECTPEGGVHLGQWNASLGLRWSRFMDALRYRFGDVQYLAVKEVQRRGALHLHVPVVFRGERPAVIELAELRRLAVAHGFGHEVACDRFDPQSKRGRLVASYVAKYVTKAATDQPEVPWVDRRTGEVGPARWRTWTASRQWGCTMGQVRAQAAEWVRVGAGAGRRPQVERVAVAPLDPYTVCSGMAVGEPLPGVGPVAM